MTQNQIAAKAHRETVRSNKVRERETERSNRVSESLKGEDIRAKKFATSMNTASNIISNALTASKMANDPQWYSLDPQMVKDVASISYETPLGYGVKPGNTLVNLPSTIVPENKEVLTLDYSIPGVVGIEYIPMLGNSNIVKTAALNIYSYVRHANSGSRNYEYQDLMKYLYAVDSIYIGLAELKRIYSILNTYKGHNRFYSEGYIKAMGYNPDTFVNVNLAALRYSINEMVQSVNALYIPNVMSMYIRHDWMSTGIFKDSEIKRSSNYLFVAKYIYKYNEDIDSPAFGCLVPVPLSMDGTLDGIIRQVKECLQVLKLSEDIGIMSGDILKAYGNSNMFLVRTMTEDYHVEETYSKEVLSQINAATTFYSIYTPSFYIYEDKNGELKQGYNSDLVKADDRGELNIDGNTTPLAFAMPNIPVSNEATNIYAVKKDLILNMYKDDVTPDDNMVASRLMVATDVRPYPIKGNANAKYLTYRILSTGTDMAISTRYVLFNHHTNQLEILEIYDGRQVTRADQSGANLLASCVSCLDWAPRFRQFVRTETGSKDTPYHLTLMCDNKDLCNYAVITESDLDRMHRVAVNSELGVPLLGMQVRR